MEDEVRSGTQLGRRRLWGAVAGVTATAAALTADSTSPAVSATAPDGDRRLAAILRNPRTKSNRVLRYVLRRTLASDLPGLLQAEASNPASPMRVALASVFQPAGFVSPLDAGAGAGLLPPSTALFGWDDFHRSDRVLPGDVAPSGQTYRATGNVANLTIQNHRHTPRPLPAHADILHLDHPGSVSTIATEFSWTSGSTNRHNVVIGACPVSFGAGSIQLAVFAGHTRPDDPDWTLFCVMNDGTGIVYPTLASGQFAGGFSFARDDATKYRVTLHRTSLDTVLVQLPDGQVQTVTDDLIRRFWGPCVGLQLRRPSVGDGHAAFTAFATAR